MIFQYSPIMCRIIAVNLPLAPRLRGRFFKGRKNNLSFASPSIRCPTPSHKLRYLTQSLSVLCSSPTPSHQKIRLRQAYTLSFYLSVMGRVSPVPNHTFHTYRFLYTEGFLRAAFQYLHTFHGFHPYAQSSASPCSLARDLFNDTAEFTLCYGLYDCSLLLLRLLYPLA